MEGCKWCHHLILIWNLCNIMLVQEVFSYLSQAYTTVNYNTKPTVRLLEDFCQRMCLLLDVWGWHPSLSGVSSGRSRQWREGHLCQALSSSVDISTQHNHACKYQSAQTTHNRHFYKRINKNKQSMNGFNGVQQSYRYLGRWQHVKMQPQLLSEHELERRQKKKRSKNVFLMQSSQV